MSDVRREAGLTGRATTRLVQARQTTRAQRLDALTAAHIAQRVVAIITDACLSDWRAALDAEACAMWIESQNAAAADEDLAVRWTEFLRLVGREAG